MELPLGMYITLFREGFVEVPELIRLWACSASTTRDVYHENRIVSLDLSGSSKCACSREDIVNYAKHCGVSLQRLNLGIECVFTIGTSVLVSRYCPNIEEITSNIVDMTDPEIFYPFPNLTTLRLLSPREEVFTRTLPLNYSEFDMTCPNLHILYARMNDQIIELVSGIQSIDHLTLYYNRNFEMFCGMFVHYLKDRDKHFVHLEFVGPILPEYIIDEFIRKYCQKTGNKVIFTYTESW